MVLPRGDYHGFEHVTFDILQNDDLLVMIYKPYIH